jgi:hypothetical protein
MINILLFFRSLRWKPLLASTLLVAASILSFFPITQPLALIASIAALTISNF